MTAGALKALGFGLLSAASLPLGAALGLLFSPVPPRFVALCMAFGSGALVYAVATDLFGEALHRLQEVQDKSSDEFRMLKLVLFAETISGVFGALLYLGLNRLLEDHGSSHSETQEPLHAPATSTSNVDTLARTMPAARPPTTWTPARNTSGFSEARELEACSFPLPAPCPRTMEIHPVPARERLAQARSSYGSNRIVASFHHETRIVSNRAKNVAMSMWLGVTLDGIPESVMMGFMAKQDSLTKVLVASIFIANFPEAFSAASMLKSHSMNSGKIMMMWCSVFVNTGLLAMLGWVMMPGKVIDFSPTDMAMNILTGVMQGITGGAMMAMTSTAMLPEAFHGAGNLSGLLFVTGFLVSVAVKGLDVCF